MSEMNLIPEALKDAVRQLPSASFLKVLGGSLLLIFVVTLPFLVVFVGVAGLLQWLLPASLELPWLGEVSFLGVFTQGLASKASWVFWAYVIAPLAMALIGFFLETIVDAVEARHYPALPKVRHRSAGEMGVYALRFFLMMLAVSLAAFIVSLFSGIFAPVVFIVANGYLIGREYFETVALRRVSEAEAAALVRAHRLVLFALGALLALALNVPFLNLLVPLIGVAAFTHLFHRLA